MLGNTGAHLGRDNVGVVILLGESVGQNASRLGGLISLDGNGVEIGGLIEEAARRVLKPVRLTVNDGESRTHDRARLHLVFKADARCEVLPIFIAAAVSGSVRIKDLVILCSRSEEEGIYPRMPVKGPAQKVPSEAEVEGQARRDMPV